MSLAALNPFRLAQHMPIGARLAILAILCAGVSMAASIYLTVREADSELHRQGLARLDANMRVAWDVIGTRGSVFSVDGDKLMVGTHVLNGDTQTVDRVKAAVGGVATVFLGDLRITTNIARPDGTRAVGTRLAPGVAYDAVVRDSRSYRGPNIILGQPYFTAYDPIKDAAGKTIGIVFVGIPEAEFKSAIDGILRSAASVGGAMLLAVGLLIWLVVRATMRPLGTIEGAMVKIAGGDATTAIPGTERRDEIGRMAAALAVFRDRMVENERAVQDRMALEARASEERRGQRVAMAEELDRAVRDVIGGLSRSTHDLSRTAEDLTRTAEGTRSRAQDVALAASETTSNVQTVAAATEELSASTREIARRVGDSAAAASAAVTQAEATNATVAALSQAAGKIGDVVKLINDIAGQTNLLALNATIEAARAGDAGKGFAVVASEVKNLATQTAKATEDISRQIGEIQGATRQAVGDIQSIGQAIKSIHGTATEIASAVDQQGAATNEITRNIQEAARGTQAVAATIAHVTEAAEATGNAVAALGGATQSVSGQSDRLKGEVEGFVARLRAS
jgi:methyl-accepting chemotaxis protein